MDNIDGDASGRDAFSPLIESDGKWIPGTGPSDRSMIANTYHDVATRSLDDFKTLDGARNRLEPHADR